MHARRPAAGGVQSFLSSLRSSPDHKVGQSIVCSWVVDHPLGRSSDGQWSSSWASGEVGFKAMGAVCVIMGGILALLRMPRFSLRSGWPGVVLYRVGVAVPEWKIVPREVEPPKRGVQLIVEPAL